LQRTNRRKKSILSKFAADYTLKLDKPVAIMLLFGLFEAVANLGQL
jgi:hypothetical protein